MLLIRDFCGAQVIDIAIERREMTEFKSFTVLILTHNDEEMIARLLGDLVDVETVLVVDNCEDKTVDICRAFGRSSPK